VKNIRIPAILGGALALLLSVPFAAAYSLAYSDWGAAHMIRLGIALDPLLSFHRSNEVVYRTYGQVFALVHPLLWLAARNWFNLHPPQTGRERRARTALLWGGGLAALAARFFLLSFLVSIAATFALAHFPSGPTFGYALAWLVWALRVKQQAA
jgi:hypothetical protein